MAEHCDEFGGSESVGIAYRELGCYRGSPWCQGRRAIVWFLGKVEAIAFPRERYRAVGMSL
ncbi:MAG: hypothetical protein AAFY26_13895 [Cyanobacteria bacterium J06638_22]